VSELNFNTAELGNRLRRALGLRGGVALELQDQVVPVATILAADGAPYRSNGFRIWGRRGLGPSVGNLTSFLVCPVVGTGVKLVVDSLILTSDEAAVQKVVVGIVTVTVSPAPAASGPFSLELDFPPTAFATGNVPVTMAITQQVGSLLSAGLTDFYVPATSSQILPMDFTIPDGFGLMVETNVANRSLAVGVFGRVFLPV
jgi:hypothetical protein